MVDKTACTEVDKMDETRELRQELTESFRYRWLVRVDGASHVYTTPRRLTDQQAIEKYGDLLVERIEASRE